MMMVLIPFTGKCNYGEYGSIDDLKHIGIKFGFVEEYDGNIVRWGVHIVTMEPLMKVPMNEA